MSILTSFLGAAVLWWSAHSIGQSTSSPIDVGRVLVRVNAYRNAHRAPDVTWSASLARAAQDWSDRMAKTGVFAHGDASERNGRGENLAMLYRSSFDPTTAVASAVDLWYDEASSYSFADPGFDPYTGHFTQLVWVSTRQIGAGAAWTNGSRFAYVTMQFDPPGNAGGPSEYSKNVLALTDSSTTSSPPPSPFVQSPPSSPPKPRPSPRSSPSPRPSPRPNPPPRPRPSPVNRLSPPPPLASSSPPPSPQASYGPPSPSPPHPSGDASSARFDVIMWSGVGVALYFLLYFAPPM